MIQKVKNQNIISDIESTSSIERESVSKSAVDAFAKILDDKIINLNDQGLSLSKIASQLNLDENYVQQVLTPACDCQLTKTASVHEENKSSNEQDAALEAYNALHNKKVIANDKNIKNSKSIFGSYSESLKDENNGNKQMKSLSSNSIWDSEIISKNSKIKTNDEILKANKLNKQNKKEELKQSSRYQTINGENLIDLVKDVDTRKDQQITHVSASENNNYSNSIPKNGISIFDQKEFSNIPKKTAGEKLKKANQDKKIKDRSWEKLPETVSSKKIFDQMIDNMLGEK